MNRMNKLIYFDGSCKPNPGLMGIGIYVVHDQTLNISRKLPHGTNNRAEWLAAEAALRLCLERDWKNVIIHGDSQCVIHGLNGDWKVRNTVLLQIAQRCLTLIGRIRAGGGLVKFKWLSREQNAKADRLSKLALGIKI